MADSTFTSSGATAELEGYIVDAVTAGDVATPIAAAAYDRSVESPHVFSFKRDGEVLHPDATLVEADFDGASCLELVEVTDYEWPA